MIQTLESRVHLDASYDLGLLSVVGTNSADKIALSIVNNRVQVVLNGVTTSYGGVKRILVGGLGGDDQISIAPNITRPATINAGDGNDAIAHGGGNDTVFGGAGDDLILGANLASVTDRDSILGEAGNDTLVDNAGDDVLRGGAGADRIECDTGLNALLGEADNDTIVFSDVSFDVNSYFDGGAGTDTFDFSLVVDDLRLDLNTQTQANAQAQTASILAYGFVANKLTPASRSRLANFDTVLSGSGDDTIEARLGLFDPTLPDNTSLTPVLASFRVDAGAGSDTVNYNKGANDPLREMISLDRTTLIGGAGNDSIYYHGSKTAMPVVDAGEGSDLVEHHQILSDFSNITFGDGVDTLRISHVVQDIVSFSFPADLENLNHLDGQIVDLVANDLDNIITSNVIENSLDARGGNDRIAVQIDGTLSGGTGDDRITVTGGGTVHGNNGNDRIEANGDAFSLFGDAGNDRIVSHSAASISGGSGNDYIVGSASADTVDLLDTERDTYIGTGGGDDVDADAIDLVLQV